MQETVCSSGARTTLFLLASVDGKITSGATDALDPDADWKRIHGVKEGLGQYYHIEKTTDLHSFISGRVLAKLGVNNREIAKEARAEPPMLSSIVVDRKPWLTAQGVRALACGLKRLYLVTNNPAHPALGLVDEVGNLTTITYPGEIDFADLFRRMKQSYEVESITIQSGGTLNAVLLRSGLIDRLVLVMAPLLVGGKATPTMVDGASLRTMEELPALKALTLTKCEVLSDSYVRLEYDVIQETVIDP